MPAPEYSIITPSTGNRPTALRHALQSVLAAMEHAGLPASAVEMLIGYDGVKGPEAVNHPSARFLSLPRQGNFGNGVRRMLLAASKGRRLIFLDDDNALTPQAFLVYEEHRKVEMLIARIDVSRAFDCDYLPRSEPGRELVRPSNIDPLCLCLTRELVIERCDSWRIYEGYESDYHNILRYYRRARTVVTTESVVGIYDAGRGMDSGGMNLRQQKREGRMVP